MQFCAICPVQDLFSSLLTVDMSLLEQICYVSLSITDLLLLMFCLLLMFWLNVK